ncbi:rlpA-like double-psi beta-barrel domain-containing protein [Artemisia annua]|uniref:RlpA-like double-psi beta-barrel domain-containing protein n=1 Tax=Artemisia annua TaxID=35608 RepID=A0A2U1QBF8_ARTAN|nr:rlpA-like double-psi beta-barrel domain-containing protein [Artemisia annua]
MKQSTLSFVLFCLLVTLFVSRTNAQSGGIKATLTMNNFEHGGSGSSGPSECDGKYHSNDTPIVALATEWYANGQRCGKYINIYYNDRSVQAKVVDECECKDIVDASVAVWKALGVPKSLWGEAPVTWSDA